MTVSERRQKGIKKRKRGVGEEKSTKTWKATIKEIDADMPNVVETIMIEKNDWSKLYRSIQHICGKDNQDMGEEAKMEKSVEDMVPTRFHKYLLVFKKKESDLCTNHGITQSRPNWDSSQRNQKCMHYHQKSRRKWMILLMNSWEKDIYDPQNHHKHHQYFSFQKKIIKKECAQITII